MHRLVFLSRNPFLSRAGFDLDGPGRPTSSGPSRNPFLSRAGFDNKSVEKIVFRLEESQSLFK